MEETRSLFQDAKAHLLDFFKASSENPYLVRFLLEHQPLLGKVYGEEGAKELFLNFSKPVFWAPTGWQARAIWKERDTTTLLPLFLKARKLDPRHR